VHDLADRFRGAVWEEVILHLPKDVKVISLSATVSNAEEFGAWLDEVRGDTEIIVSEHRPVPLSQHVLFGTELMPLFDGAQGSSRVNSELVQQHANKLRQPINKPTRGRRSYPGQNNNSAAKIYRASKAEIVDILDEADLLPAIFFIFSRAGCEAAVKNVLSGGIRLTKPEDKQVIRRIAEEKCAAIADEDLSALGYFEWLNGLERGVAAHHAGMLPAFKEVVEELFLRKLVKVVFATETLALGINMPARSVVLDRLDKFNGESRVQITPGEYTQLTGRAGRRGIDIEGHSVIQWAANLDPNVVAGLASKRTYPLNSSFRPTYNMAVNLVDAFGRKRAREVLETSFAQFQADRSVVGLARGIKDRQEALTGYATAMECHLGDFERYAQIRRDISDLEKQLAQAGRGGRAKDIRQTKGRATLERNINELKRELRSHRCHQCPDREAHARWAERWHKLDREISAVLKQIDSRTNQVAKTFDRICDLLIELDYLTEGNDGDLEVTEAGSRLAKIYGDRDLLVTECITRKTWDSLDAPSLAALVAALVYESRRDEEDLQPRLPRGAFGQVFAETEEIWDQLEEISARHKLPKTSAPDVSICLQISRWASGATLDSVLRGSDLLAGDFIRFTKQIIDLLEQIAQNSTGTLAETANLAIDKVKRGIVAYSYYA
jgi:ATP-dependent RNA helicase HelY